VERELGFLRAAVVLRAPVVDFVFGFFAAIEFILPVDQSVLGGA